MYKVLWIDDQYNDPEMIQFAIEADSHDLILEGFSSFEEGFDALDRKLEQFDVILLDGLFFEKKGQEAGTEDEYGIGMAIAKINEFKSRKVFPWFVLSGKDKFTKGENSLLKANKAICFDKTKPSDVLKLFEAMKAAASHQPEFQIKSKYLNLLQVCADNLLGQEQFSRLFALIKHIENADKLVNTEDMLNPIRKILERMFKRLSEIGIIPDTITSNKGWINGSRLFLENKHAEYEHLTEIVPPLISENIFRLLNIVQDASHGEGELRLKVDHYLKTAQSDFFYKSCVFLLFELLLWFKEFLEHNSNEDTNKARWKSKVWIIGTVALIAENGWGTFQPNNARKTIGIPPQILKNYQLKETDLIKIITEASPDGTKTFIKAVSREI